MSTVHLESPSGRGKVSNDAGDEIATVEYNLIVTRDDLIDRRTGERIEGLKSATGSIRILNGDIEDGEMYTLTFADGRSCQFFIHQHNTGSSESISITVSGGIK